MNLRKTKLVLYIFKESIGEMRHTERSLKGDKIEKKKEKKKP